MLSPDPVKFSIDFWERKLYKVILKEVKVSVKKNHIFMGTG